MKSSAADSFPALFKVSSIALLCFQDISSLVLTSSRLGKNSFFSSKSDKAKNFPSSVSLIERFPSFSLFHKTSRKTLSLSKLFFGLDLFTSKPFLSR